MYKRQLKGLLAEMGFGFTDSAENADLVLFNTCAVRESAEDRVFGNVGALKNIKRERPELMIALCGCMMQQQHIADKIKKSFPFVDLVFGTHVVYRLPELIYKTLTGKKRVFETPDADGVIAEGVPVLRDEDKRAWLPIMYGCNNFCTYCIVPYVRGREISREPKDIIMEIERLVKDGVKEVMLLGQNVDSYGKTLDNPVSFAQLLREIDKIEGLERIRFMTPHPKDIEEETLEVIRDSKKICNHIHFPLQSGSSRLLKLMNRKYTKEHYLEQVEMIRRILPDVSITTDIIVGFPGETEEDFEDTIDVVKKAKFDSAYTFIYSKRTGTPAARMENQVPEDVVKDRFNRLLATVNEVSHEHIRRYEGMDMKVLVEGKDDHEEGFVTGRMTNNILVHFAGDESLIGQIVTVHLDECKGFYYMGRLIED